MIVDWGFRISDYLPGRRCAPAGSRSVLRGPRPAMTLVELLVVISIMAILLGVAIPVISPADDSRRLRESARAVHTFINGAKTRAKETGRPFGVAFKKLSQDTGRVEDNGACLEIYYVEELPPYAGFDSNARVRLALNPYDSDDDQSSIDRDDDEAGVYRSRPDYVDGGVMVQFVRLQTGQNEAELPAGYDYDPIPPIFGAGDVIEVAGRRYMFDKSSAIAPLTGNLIAGVTDASGNYNFSGSAVTAFAVDRQPANVHPTHDTNGDRIPNSQNLPPFWTEALPYKILRKPTKASGEPMQLNEKTAIDLEGSGFGNGQRLHNPYQLNAAQDDAFPRSNPNDVIVMFSPEGAMYETYLNGGPVGAAVQRSLISSSLFLLVGLRENLPAPEHDFDDFAGTDRDKQDLKSEINWLNGDAAWVVISAQTGGIATAENAFVDPERLAFTDANNPATGPLPTGGVARSQALTVRRNAEIQAAREFARQAVSRGGK